MTDFFAEVERLYRNLKGTNSTLRKLAQADTSTRIRAQAQAKQQMETLDNGIRQLHALLNSQRAVVTPDEFNRRKGVVRQLEISYNQLSSTVHATHRHTEPKPTSLQKDSEYSKFSNQHLAQKSHQMLQEQEVKIDQLHNTALSLKSSSLEIRDELDVHISLLDNIEQGVDLNTLRLTKTQSRMAGFIDKSSHSCLFWLITALLVIMVLLILYF